MFMALTGITEKVENLFELIYTKDADRILTQEENTRLQIVIELTDEVILIERQVYNLFTLLGDVGGLSGLLYAIGSVLSRTFNFANAQNSVVQSLYQG